MAQTYVTRRRSGKHGSSDAKNSDLSRAPETNSRMEIDMSTGKKLGFKKGDFVHTGAYPGIIISDVQSFAPVCEVWGHEHESGSAYADDLVLLNWPTFESLAKRYGFDGSAYSKVAKEAIKSAQARISAQGTPVTA
jgi:hypothetical protein